MSYKAIIPEVEKIKQRIGNNLQYLREISGLTQQELAKELKMVQFRINAAEHGEIPSLEALYPYSQYFQVSLGALIDHDFKENPSVLLRDLLDETKRNLEWRVQQTINPS